MLTLTPSHDPIARYSLLGCAVLIGYVLIASMTAPAPVTAQADPDPIIIVATPALPTPAPGVDPALALGIATPVISLTPPTPQVVYVEVPGPTPQPEVVYVTVQGAVDTPAPASEAAPAYDPNVHPDEAAAALTEAYQGLPTAGAPPDASAEAASHDYQQRRLDAGAYRPRTR